MRVFTVIVQNHQGFLPILSLLIYKNFATFLLTCFLAKANPDNLFCRSASFLPDFFNSFEIMSRFIIIANIFLTEDLDIVCLYKQL